MRAFLAFPIPPEVKRYLNGVAKRMASRVEGVKWVGEEGQHITVKFFGDLDDGLAREMETTLSPIGLSYGPFPVNLQRIDAFPGRKRARVIVVTLSQGVDNIGTIFHAIESFLSALGVEKEERNLIPHITLGRRRVPAPLLERDVPDLDEVSFSIDRLVLFRSTLTPKGPIYDRVWEIPLKGRRDGKDGEG